MSHFLDRLSYFSQPKETFSGDHGVTTGEDRTWEDAYRDRWAHDKIVRSTHGVHTGARLVQIGSRPRKCRRVCPTHGSDQDQAAIARAPPWSRWPAPSQMLPRRQAHRQNSRARPALPKTGRSNIDEGLDWRTRVDLPWNAPHGLPFPEATERNNLGAVSPGVLMSFFSQKINLINQ
jgi:hypothetical protein